MLQRRGWQTVDKVAKSVGSGCVFLEDYDNDTISCQQLGRVLRVLPETNKQNPIQAAAASVSSEMRNFRPAKHGESLAQPLPSASSERNG